MARPMPISRGSFCERPQPGRIPTRACVSAKRASLEAIRRSQASASSKPPVMAKPFTAPITGPGKPRIAPIMSSSVKAPSGCALRLPSSLRSRPAQKARPAPVRITTRTSASCASSRKPRVRAWRSSCESAFIASGRFSVTRATPALFSTSSTGEDIGDLRKEEARGYGRARGPRERRRSARMTPRQRIRHNARPMPARAARTGKLRAHPRRRPAHSARARRDLRAGGGARRSSGACAPGGLRAARARPEGSAVPWQRVVNARGEVSPRRMPGWDGAAARAARARGHRASTRAAASISRAGSGARARGARRKQDRRGRA